MADFLAEKETGEFLLIFSNDDCIIKYITTHNPPITENKLIYHAQNVNRWKGSVEPRSFIGLLILDMINRFIFAHGHGVVIYYVLWINTFKHSEW